MNKLIYRNLHQNNYSVRVKGIVIHREEWLLATDVTFSVSAKGHARVLATGQRNVHAGLKTSEPVSSSLEEMFIKLLIHGENLVRVTYNPYNNPWFFAEGVPETPLTKAKMVFLTPYGCYAKLV